MLEWQDPRAKASKLLNLFPLLAGAALASPQFDVERGLYDEAFELSITAEDSDSSVYYSTDGSEPALPWAGPLWIEGTSTIRAVEVDDSGELSATITHSYLFVEQVIGSTVMDQAIVADTFYGPALERTLRELPSASIVLPGALDTSEQQVSFEWIEPGVDTLQLSCGGRRVGGHSLGYDKTSLRLNFRSEYGSPKLEADLFADFATGVPPADDHDALTLRSGSHDSVFYLGAQGQYLRNRWMDETQLELGHLMPHGRYFHLYVNGEYTGLYHLRERFGAAFMAEYLGGDEDDYEAVNGGEVTDGTGVAWSALLAASSSYEALGEHLRLEQYLDYMILNFYAANDWDWLEEQNWMAAGPVRPGGAWIFHASDNDICLYYDADTNILDNPGPSGIFAHLLAEAHPDFLALLADRLYALLEADGPLSAEASSARWLRLAAQIDDAVVAESARWGGGWWDRDDEWLTEQARLLEAFFPLRTELLLQQARQAGWYPLGPPELSHDAGLVEPGITVTAWVPHGVDAELWWSLNGRDPRQPGGEPAEGAIGPADSASAVLELSTLVQARLRRGEQWGPLRAAMLEVDGPPPIVLNEWNAVDQERWLDDDGQDDALGRVQGNGGDWIELLVLEDGLDLRGWRLAMEDRAGPAGVLIFTQNPALSNLWAGTLITIAEDLPEDTAYDPQAGDWRFHLRASQEGSGAYVSASDFEVTHREWQLTISDAEGHIRFGPVGEGIAPAAGISSREVGLLAADPSEDLRRDSGAYRGGRSSSFGAANHWDEGEQDLSVLRGEFPDTGVAPHDSQDTGEPMPATEPGCGCGTRAAPAGIAVAILALLSWVLWRRSWPLVAVIVGCQPRTVITTDTDTSVCFEDWDGDRYGDPERAVSCDAGVPEAGDCDDQDASIHPGAVELCTGRDEDCDGLVDGDDPELADGLPFYADLDGDGYGDEDNVVTACTMGEGLALVGGDCDDQDPGVNPGAEDLCDGVDLDCDGIAATGSGATEACAAESCLQILEELGSAEDGAYWLALPSGELARVHCDMSTEGGGWTLGFLRNTAATGSQGDFCAEDHDPDLLDLSPAEASASSEPSMAWLGLNQLVWDSMQLAAYLHGAQTYRSRAIPRSALRLDFGQDGYLLYGGETGYYWCGGDRSYSDDGVGAVNNPVDAPADCRGHGSLGSGWDFSESTGANQGLTLCGGDGSAFLSGSWGGSWVYYGAAGGAQAIWVR